MKKFVTSFRLAITLCLAAMTMISAARAATAVFNFDTDPTGLYTLYGSGNWRATDGNPATGGYLAVTDAINSENTTIVFDDFDAGQVVRAFSFSMDVRIGGGTDSPADGFSVNYARANDPVVATGTGFAASPTGEGNLPEEGTTTGLAVGFDAWFSGGADVIGISVRLDNVILTNIAFPTLNGACNDTNSLQTGPRDPANPGSPGLLCWQPFTVNLDTNGALTITYKGRIVVTNFQTSFFPSPGRLVFAGRTGGANQNTHVDNIRITTIPAASALVGPVTSPNAAGFTLEINDSGSSVVNTNTIALQLNGASVTPTFISKNGGLTTIKYQIANPSQFLPVGSSNTVDITFRDTNNNQISASRGFIVPAYTTVPASFAVPAGSVDTNKPGFMIRPYQTLENQPNSLAWTEEQLMGLRGPNLADLTLATNTIPGLGTNGYIQRDTVINFDIGTGAGNFTAATGFADEPLPGIPGPTPPSATDPTMNSTEEVITWLYFPSGGFYTMGVNSDDGFRVTTGNNPLDRFAVNLGQFDGGRGASDTLFSFSIPQAGYYPFRLIWENGGGGANVEWFSVAVNGSKVLVNDTTNPNAIRAYRSGPVFPAYVSSVTPVQNSTGARPDIVSAQITDAGTTVSSATIQVNGSGSSTSVKTGGVTTVTFTMPPYLASGSSNSATLVYTDSASRTVTNTWTFVVAAYSTLSASLASPIGSGDASQPGFLVRVHQVDQVGDVGTANLIARAEQQLAGIIGPNVANLVNATNNGFFITSNGWINLNQDVGATDAGNFRFNTTPPREDEAIPGIPGTGNPTYNTDNIAAEFITYVEYPTAGIYTLGVNSDDGFRTTATDVAPSNNLALVITPTGGSPVSYYAVSGGTDGGGGYRPITNPISGRVVYATPADACGPLANAAAIAGNIALIDRGTCTFQSKAQAARDAGAIAVIIVNNRLPDSPNGKYPIIMPSPGADIPAVMISSVDGNAIKAALAAGAVNASLTPDTTPVLGEFNSGRGASDTLFSFSVPAAGVYPLRTVWYEGGGGANIEIFSVDASGTKVLLNDTNFPTALRTFRARTAVNFPRITSIFRSGGNVTVTWTGGGTLDSSPTLFPVNWTSTGDSDGSFTEPATGISKFYRVRR